MRVSGILKGDGGDGTERPAEKRFVNRSGGEAGWLHLLLLQIVQRSFVMSELLAFRPGFQWGGATAAF